MAGNATRTRATVRLERENHCRNLLRWNARRPNPPRHQPSTSREGNLTNFTARFATEAEQDKWDDLVTANPDGGNVLQSASFAEVKSHHGWKPLFLVLESD